MCLFFNSICVFFLLYLLPLLSVFLCVTLLSSYFIRGVKYWMKIDARALKIFTNVRVILNHLQRNHRSSMAQCIEMKPMQHPCTVCQKNKCVCFIITTNDLQLLSRRQYRLCLFHFSSRFGCSCSCCCFSHFRLLKKQSLVLFCRCFSCCACLVSPYIRDLVHTSPFVQPHTAIEMVTCHFKRDIQLIRPSSSTTNKIQRDTSFAHRKC